MRAPRCGGRAVAGLVLTALCGAVMGGGQAGADPYEPYDPATHFDQPQPLPAVTPAPAGWQPKFPPPFDRTRQFVTDADINAEREMCGWYNAQYKVIQRHIAGLNNAVIRANGDWNSDEIPQHADIVAANLDQSVAFLAPRIGALTRSADRAGDMYFPLYQGDSFHGLWQQMSNVSNGIKARQPTWFSGPSYHQMQFWGSKIKRSRACV
ncbi:hypothetical protein MSEN_37350 [Mycolicibacter senuensis]|uniref:Uncharacterized protein n=2 Tax=Mycolicibacter senuensis TaxID=386913 RepID=A0A7I9XPW0_9MYCO|nr:hypothetical protein MSEN_37350 [Mycolicibacter senuensis]